MVAVSDALLVVVIVLAVALGVVVIAVAVIGAIVWFRKRPQKPDNEAGQSDEWGQLGLKETLSDQAIAHIKPPKIENLAAYKRLEELLVQDPTAASFIADALGARALDEVAQSFVMLFEAHGKGIPLIKHFIDVEMTRAHSSDEGPGTLFRMDSTASKIMKFYCKLIGHQYLTSVLWPQIRAVLLADEFIELDKAKMKEGDSLIENLCNFQDVIANFLEAIINSSSSCPQQLRLICQHLSSKAMELFPYSHLKVVGGFIFLRFFTPAVMAPITYGIIEGDLTSNQSRTLVLVAKVLQNLANGLLFGEKEQYMMPMNEFLSANFPLVQSFLADLATKHPKEVFATVPISSEARLVALRVIHFNLLRFSARLKPANNPALHEQIQAILKELDDYAALPTPPAQDQLSTSLPDTSSTPIQRPSLLLTRGKDLKTTSTRSGGNTNVDPSSLPSTITTVTVPLSSILPPVASPLKKSRSLKEPCILAQPVDMPNPRLYRPPSNPRSVDAPQDRPTAISPSYSPNNSTMRYSSPPKQPSSPQSRFSSPPKQPAQPRAASPKKSAQPRVASPKKSTQLPSDTNPSSVKPTATKKKQSKSPNKARAKSPTKRKKKATGPTITTLTTTAPTVNKQDNNGEDEDEDDDGFNVNFNFNYGDAPQTQTQNLRTPSMLSLDLSNSSLDNSVK